MKRFRRILAGVAGAGLLAVLGGAATGLAGTTQQVAASLVCQPVAIAPPAEVGCVLTVTNNGSNTANSVTVTDVATGGTFTSTTKPSQCSGIGTSTLTCDIGKLAGGAIFTETHELSATSALSQEVSGRFSAKPNSRGSDTIDPVTVQTPADVSGDFDGTFADDDGDSVETSSAISASNPYTTRGVVNGQALFADGLTVHDGISGAGNPNCPNGCFGDKIVRFDITPLAGGSFPDSFTLSWVISGAVVPNGTQAFDVDIFHNGSPVPFCSIGTDPGGACIVSITIDPPTKNITVVAQGPGSGNGDWGAG